MSEADQSDGRRHSLNTRTTRRLRDRLEAAATASGRSLAQEVEARLEHSFAEEDVLKRIFGEPHNMHLVRAFALILTKIQDATGKRWSQDLETLRQCQIGVEQLLYSVWGGSRRDKPRKDADYIARFDSRFPEGIELAAVMMQHTMSELGLGFPRDLDDGPEPPPEGLAIDRTEIRNKRKRT